MSVSFPRRTKTDKQGDFEFFVPRDADYRIGIELGPDASCHVWQADRGITHAETDAALVQVGARNVTGLALAVPQEVCTHQIKGTLIGPQGAPLKGIQLLALSEGGPEPSRITSVTAADGTFKLQIPRPGSYRVAVDLGGCRVFYGHGRIAFAHHLAPLVHVERADVSGFLIQLDEGMCRYRLTGLLLDAEGVPIADAWVSVSSDLAGATTTTDSEGAFEINVPLPDSYRLRANQDGCFAYWRNGDTPTTWERASLINISSGDVRAIQLQLREGMCEQQLSGVLLDASGNGLGNVELAALSDDDSSHTTTGADGTFSMAVSTGASYVLRVSLDGCFAYYRSGLAVGQQGDAAQVAVAQQAIQGVRIQLQDGMCEYRLSGVLLDASGNGLADVRVTAIGDAGHSTALTAEDGKFSISVPIAGSYQVNANLDGCFVYYRQGGTVTRRRDADAVEVASVSVPYIRFQVDGGFCVHKISGRLIGASGEGLGDVRVQFLADGGGTETHTESDGAFAITVPRPALYRVRADLDGCFIYYRLDGVATSHGNGYQVDAREQSVSGVNIQLPDGICEHAIRGTLVDSAGRGVSGIWLSAQTQENDTGVITDADGGFAMHVQSDGQYRLRAQVDSCGIYRRDEGATTDWNDATTVIVSGEDATGILFRLPQDPAGLCDQ